MAFHPTTGQLWFTDTARDWQSDTYPPDEVNIITSAGQHFGYPYCASNNIADPDANPNGVYCNSSSAHIIIIL
jgi:glucose/arabinose dehydrogenase